MAHVPDSPFSKYWILARSRPPSATPERACLLAFPITLQDWLGSISIE
jgi:hypothetical protein